MLFFFLSSLSLSLWSSMNQNEMAHRQRFYVAGNHSSPANSRNKGKCHGLSSGKHTHTHTHTHFWKREGKKTVNVSFEIGGQGFFSLCYITIGSFFFRSYPALENKSRLWIEFCYRQQEHDTQTHCAREGREKRKERKKKIHKCKSGRVYCATTRPNKRDLHIGIEWANY